MSRATKITESIRSRLRDKRIKYHQRKDDEYQDKATEATISDINRDMTKKEQKYLDRSTKHRDKAHKLMRKRDKNK